LLGLLFLLLRSCDRDEPETETTTVVPAEQTTTTTTVTPNTPNAAATPALPVERVTLPGGRAVELEPNTLNYQLQQFLASSEPAPRRFTFDRLNFATSSADLPGDAQGTVSALAQILQAYPNAAVRVEGYADARGSEGANAQLGARRAEAVAQALIAQGVPANRVTAASGGETNPVDTNATAQGQAENRRTDLVVTAK
jgi:outer membrane protein OmpA-like peptidoglycan-associated protein